MLYKVGEVGILIGEGRVTDQEIHLSQLVPMPTESSAHISQLLQHAGTAGYH